MTKEYVALPVRVEAMQVDLHSRPEEVFKWLVMHNADFSLMHMSKVLRMPTALNRKVVTRGDWVVRSKTGGFAIYTNDEFWSMFKSAEEA